MKTVVTHQSPDIDAITSVWLIRKYLPGWSDAQLAFVPAGKTLEDKNPDENPDIIHVDTGLGKFDHHQFKAKLSASLLVLHFIKEQNCIKHYDIEALDRLVQFVNGIDNFDEVFFPNPTADVYDFALYQLLEGLKPTLQTDDRFIEFGSTALEGVLQVLKNKIRAEKEIAKGMILQTSWGKTMIVESKNEELMKLAQKMGFVLVARRDPDRGFIRIKCIPDDRFDLTGIYEEIKKIDHVGTWFLHSSKHMLLNGSSKGTNFTPSSLNLKQLIEIIRKV